MITFLSPELRRRIMNSINRDSHEEKIKSFFRESEKYQAHMQHLQSLSRLRTLSWWTSKTETLEQLNFTVAVVLNLILVAFLDDSDDTDIDPGSSEGIAISILG